MRTRKQVISTALLTMAAVTRGIQLQTESDPEIIEGSMAGVNLKDYYDNCTTCDLDNDNFDVKNVLMRRDANFMQGLYYDDVKKQLVESAGLYGVSKVQWLTEDANDDGVLVQDTSTDVYNLDSSLFGEGLSPLNEDEFIVLTWQERKMLILDRNSLEFKEEYEMPSVISQGWGVTEVQSDDAENYMLYVSDGTSKVFKMDGNNMQIKKELVIKTENGTEVDKINELEYVKSHDGTGYIYANVWYDDHIVKIDPETGIIVDSWDIGSLAKAERLFQNDQKGYSAQDCLNGIAFNPDSETFYLTGKKHHLIFEVELNGALD